APVTGSTTEDDGHDKEPVVVSEIETEDLVDEPGAPLDDDVPALLALDPRDDLREVAFQDPRVLPVELLQSMGEADLVHLLEEAGVIEQELGVIRLPSLERVDATVAGERATAHNDRRDVRVPVGPHLPEELVWFVRITRGEIGARVLGELPASIEGHVQIGGDLSHFRSLRFLAGAPHLIRNSEGPVNLRSTVRYLPDTLRTLG